jgi:hypothetical protein
MFEGQGSTGRPWAAIRYSITMGTWYLYWYDTSYKFSFTLPVDTWYVVAYIAFSTGVLERCGLLRLEKPVLLQALLEYCKRHCTVL